MINQFLKYVQDENLLEDGDKTLITLSGGIDSVVMCELFFQAGFSFGIAHCNFKLRGEESDTDARFVSTLAEKYKVTLHSIIFDTKEYAKDQGISTQMAARDLRYEWFEKIRTENNYQKVATAHHQDDQLETFFINLMRGTGISGLHGIRPKNGQLIRPILFASRNEVVKFQLENRLEFREDSSNASNKYLRNKIRHHLLPILEDLDPEYLKVFAANMKRFSDSEEVYLQRIDQLRNEILTKKGDDYLISLKKLSKLNPKSTYLFEFIREFGFSFKICEDILKNFNNNSGKIFSSDTHRLLKDREYLIIRTRDIKTNQGSFNIEKTTNEIKIPIHLKIKKFEKTRDFEIPNSRLIANIDSDKLSFPLSLRKWKNGDYFYPLGSTFRKKLSDFFIDRKFSLFDKEDCWMICSGDEVVWVVGHQIDNRFKIRSKTRHILQIKYKENLAH